MKPILKWTGGKSSEIPIIKELLPKKYSRFVEPFLGGGAVYFHLETPKNVVNDFNKELIAFYNIIKDPIKFSTFKKIIEKSVTEREAAKLLVYTKKEDFFVNAYKLSADALFTKYLTRELASKTKVIERICKQKNLVVSDLEPDNYQTAVIASFYYMYRDLYNSKHKNNIYDAEHIAYWFIMRELAYSGMFRFSSNGNFNVPYGGTSYNNKNMLTKLKEVEQLGNKNFYINTEFNSLDFEELFKKYNYFNSDDFIFLDPPYDSEFSQYNKEEDFTKNDQERLRDTLLKTKAKVMVVIKHTEYIHDLYKKDFKIHNFDKNYSVNFKNRNEQAVNHLVITNY